MKAELFYETYNDKAIPLYLISEAQWEEQAKSFSASEINCFNTGCFKGKLSDFCYINDTNGFVSKAYVGTGDGNQELALAYAALLLPAGSFQPQVELNQAAAVNWALAQYRFDLYKKRDFKPRLLLLKTEDLKDILPLAEAIFLARDLVNTPTNDMGPKEMAQVLNDLAKLHGAEFQQWVGSELLENNFPAIHAVGRAAATSPRLLSLSWGRKEHPLVTLVGKGVCFDSGGLNIKSAEAMRLMKKDMGGAAHVIGLAQWIMSQSLPIRLRVLIPAVENAVGPDSLRPGDVITMRNKLTVEIDNTDAEGRLILADALAKACEEEPDLIIDFSTLTGAARVALGTDVGVMFTNRDSIAERLIETSQKVKDPLWRLPLYAGYEDLFSSTVADMSNCSSSPYGGAITAALFLQRFISPSVPWVHFDVMAWNLAAKPGKPEGGETLGFRAVAEYLLRVYG